jgi:hypothetical protein
MQEVRRPLFLLPPHADCHACAVLLPPETTHLNPRPVHPWVRLTPPYACHRPALKEGRCP